ncbi:GTP:AMP phosphotransferase AK3, mitochondrial-like [Babylonia areolata]|uniref:GTP:AMP phosphotransferase AK3, mitochondrial-like n=1 Tax=Babylonia areolata TaxID=304850 RepID=UPI003FCF5D21
MFTKFLRAIIMGPPGSGKGTIANRLAKDFGMVHLSSGDLLRTQIYDMTEHGLQAKAYMDDGKLVPDDIMTKMVLDELKKYESQCWLLDGFPRTVAQARELDHAEQLDVVMNLRVPFDVILNRIKGRWTHAKSGRIYHDDFNPPKEPGIDDVTGEPLIQRDDDKEETVRKRLEHYRRLTHPVLQYYRNKGVVEEFSGSFSNEIWPDVHKFLSTFKRPLQFTHYD